MNASEQKSEQTNHICHYTHGKPPTTVLPVVSSKHGGKILSSLLPTSLSSHLEELQKWLPSKAVVNETEQREMSHDIWTYLGSMPAALEKSCIAH